MKQEDVQGNVVVNVKSKGKTETWKVEFNWDLQGKVTFGNTKHEHYATIPAEVIVHLVAAVAKRTMKERLDMTTPYTMLSLPEPSSKN